MAGFCRFWRLTPPEYYRLTVAEVDAMYGYMADEREARERQQRQAEAKAKRRR